MNSRPLMVRFMTGFEYKQFFDAIAKPWTGVALTLVGLGLFFFARNMSPSGAELGFRIRPLPKAGGPPCAN